MTNETKTHERENHSSPDTADLPTVRQQSGSSTVETAIRALKENPELLPAVLLVLAIATFAVFNSKFLTATNFNGLIAYAPEIGLITLGMTVLLTAGEFDLSVGSVFGFTPLVMFTLINNMHVSVTVAAVVALLCAGMVGLINGIVTVKFGISSFLVTLSTQLVFAGAAVYMSSGFSQPTSSISSWVKPLLSGSISIGGLKLYAGMFWFIALAIALWYGLTQTQLGNWITAVGSNKPAALGRGIPTNRITICLFLFTSVLAGLAGIISAFRVGTAAPTAGNGYELEAIAMAVIGGTSLFGGRGTILGTVLGVALLQVIQNGVVLAGVPGLAYPIFVGGMILLAMSLQVGLQRLSSVLTRSGARV